MKTCQTLARHSTSTLTLGVYARASLHDVRGAVEALPDLAPDRPVPRGPVQPDRDQGVPGPDATVSATVVPVDATQTQVGI